MGAESIGGFIDYKSIGEELKDNLPTLYTAGDNDTNNLVDNPNTGGLVTGRPWT